MSVLPRMHRTPRTQLPAFFGTILLLITSIVLGPGGTVAHATAASITCTRRGADMPSAADVEEALRVPGA